MYFLDSLRSFCDHLKVGPCSTMTPWLSQSVSAVSVSHAKLPKVKGALYVHGCELSNKILENKWQSYPGDGVG